MKDELIETYTVEIHTPRCDPSAVEYFAHVRFETDISMVLPYLNARLKDTRYFPEAAALSWRDAGHTIVFHAREIDISEIRDQDQAEELAEDVVYTVNSTWAARAEIKPNTSGVRRAAPMALLKLLPQTNCRECGEPTCFSFALKLAAGQRSPADCPPLADPKFSASRAGLADLLPP